MSEINSIANGTFTIGQSSALTFEAGPGITIDSPSAGTVRIGNDETVLWSGTRTNEATLSESAYNFEFIRIEFDENSVSAPNPVITTIPSPVMTTGLMYGMANAFLAFLYITLTNNTALKIVSTKSVKFGSFTSTAVNLSAELNVDQIMNSIVKVVGINRKEV